MWGGGEEEGEGDAKIKTLMTLKVLLSACYPWPTQHYCLPSSFSL